jgi:hypothetical protein
MTGLNYEIFGASDVSSGFATYRNNTCVSGAASYRISVQLPCRAVMMKTMWAVTFLLHTVDTGVRDVKSTRL